MKSTSAAKNSMAFIRSRARSSTRTSFHVIAQVRRITSATTMLPRSLLTARLAPACLAGRARDSGIAVVVLGVSRVHFPQMVHRQLVLRDASCDGALAHEHEPVRHVVRPAQV